MSRRDNKKNVSRVELDDADLARLMAADAENFAPPEGLLDRLLEEIPADPSFTWAEPTDVDEPVDDGAEDDGAEDAGDEDGGDDVAPVPANDNWTRYRRWTVAAVLLTGLGLGSFMWRQLGQEATRPAVHKSEHLSAQLERKADELAAHFDDSAAPGGAAAEKQVAEPVKAQRKAEMSLPAVQNGARERKDDRGSGRDEEGRMKLKESLEALGYVDGAAAAPPSTNGAESRTPAAPVPRPSRPTTAGMAVPSAPPPPPPPPSPLAPSPSPRMEEAKIEAARSQRLKKVPIADPTPDLKVISEADVNRQLAPVEVTEAVAESEVDFDLAANDAVMAPMPMPEDAPSFFEAKPVNPFVDTAQDARSTFGLDVDTGSYTVVRDYLRRDRLPPRHAVRVEEMLNYFDYGDRAPTREDFAITVDGAPSIYGPDGHSYLMRVGIQSRVVDPYDRPPTLLVFVVDTSGSMSGPHRLGLVKKSLDLLLGELRPTDRVALVEYGTQGRVLLNPTSDLQAIRRGIESLQTNGSTNMEEGLRLAYGLAVEHKKPGGIHRVLLCSDGVANVGATTADAVLESVRRHAMQGIELTTVGFGMGNYNDLLMERLADQGNGRYAYVDTLSEAHRIFVRDLTGTLQTLAAEARSQVVFDPDVVKSYRLLGYENRDIADERFRDDTVDAGEIGAGHSVVALYELQTHRPLKRRQQVATVHLRYASVAAKKMVEQETVVRGSDFAPSWDEASKALRLASLVAEMAELLRGSYHARDGEAADVLRRLQRLAPEFSGDTEVAELTGLAAKVVELQRRGERPAGGS